jgi:hypothetical protein
MPRWSRRVPMPFRTLFECAQHLRPRVHNKMKCPPTYNRSRRLSNTCSKLVRYRNISKAQRCPSGTHRSRRLENTCSAIMRVRTSPMRKAWATPSSRRSAVVEDSHESPVVRIASVKSKSRRASSPPKRRSPEALFRLPPNLRALRPAGGPVDRVPAGGPRLRTAWA